MLRLAKLAHCGLNNMLLAIHEMPHSILHLSKLANVLQPLAVHLKSLFCLAHKRTSLKLEAMQYTCMPPAAMTNLWLLDSQHVNAMYHQ